MSSESWHLFWNDLGEANVRLWSELADLQTRGAPPSDEKTEELLSELKTAYMMFFRRVAGDHDVPWASLISELCLNLNAFRACLQEERRIPLPTFDVNDLQREAEHEYQRLLEGKRKEECDGYKVMLRRLEDEHERERGRYKFELQILSIRQAADAEGATSYRKAAIWGEMRTDLLAAENTETYRLAEELRCSLASTAHGQADAPKEERRRYQC